MKTLYTTAFAMLTGAAIGALAVQGLRAQTKPPAYVVTETEITNLDAYQKEYVPLAQASIKAAGGHLLAAGQNIVVFEGAPPKTRVAINQFDSMEELRIGETQHSTKKTVRSAISMRNSVHLLLRGSRSRW